MKTIQVRRTIRAPIAQVFERLTDHAGYGSFPGVRKARVIKAGAPERNGVGAIREVDAGPIWLREEILGFERPHRMDYRILDSRPPVRHEGGRMEFRQAGGSTEVIWTSTFAMPLPLLGGVAEWIVAKGAAHMFAAVLRHVDRQLGA